MIEVKPCPFCGNAPEFKAPWAACLNKKCGIFGVMMRADKWNTRADGWRNADGEKPEDFTEVLIATLDGKLKVGWWDSCLTEWMRAKLHVINDITHWKPLPEPPSVNQNDTKQ